MTGVTNSLAHATKSQTHVHQLHYYHSSRKLISQKKKSLKLFLVKLWHRDVHLLNKLYSHKKATLCVHIISGVSNGTFYYFPHKIHALAYIKKKGKPIAVMYNGAITQRDRENCRRERAE